MKYLFLISLLIGILLTESVKAESEGSFWIISLCSSKVDSDTRRSDCIEHYTKCAKKVAKADWVIKNGFNQEDVEVYFNQKPKERREMCK